MSNEKLFYIVSLKHTSKGDTALTFWGANGSGYCWDRRRAGVYTESEANKHKCEDQVPVEKEKVDPFWMNAIDFNDKYISVANTPEILRQLRLSAHLMKAKKYASCRMAFMNTPLETPQP